MKPTTSKWAISVVSFLGLGLSLIGYTGTANATSCQVTDVILFENINATSCGVGSTTNDEVSPPPSTWSVNLDSAGGIDYWAAWMKSEVVEEVDEFGQPINNPGAAESQWSEYNEADGTGDGSILDLQFTDYTGTCDTVADPGCVPELYSEGEFSIVVPDDGNLLIVLKDKNDGSGYHWYYFSGLTPGLNTGSVWNTENAFGGNNISHLTAYTTQVVPVPAAVWLFGSGLLGLVGIARRKRTG